MFYSRRSRYSRSPSPYGGDRRRSYSRSRSRSEFSPDVENPGNNLYVTGLSPRVTKRELEKHFSTEGGKVVDVNLVVDPWTNESRGFGFVTMSTVEEADGCLKYLNRSVLEGRVITVEKAKRRRGRTPTPGRYLGLKTVHERRRSPSYSPYGRIRSHSSSGYSSDERVRARYYSRFRSPYSRPQVHRRDPSYSPDFRPRSRFDRSVSPYYRRRDRSYSPYHGRHDRSYSPYCRGRDRSSSPYPRGRDRSLSPYDRRHERSISPYERRRSISPYDRRHERSISPPYDRRHSRRRSMSRGISPRARPCIRDEYYYLGMTTSSGRTIDPRNWDFSNRSSSRSRSISSVASSRESRSPPRSVTPSSGSRSLPRSVIPSPLRC